MAVGAVLGMVRIMMGAHFFSDVIFAAFFMLATSAGLHAIMYGPKATAIHWRNWLFRDGKKTVTPG
jgi:lipid A 4'-phosphatase